MKGNARGWACRRVAQVGGERESVSCIFRRTSPGWSATACTPDGWIQPEHCSSPVAGNAAQVVLVGMR